MAYFNSDNYGSYQQRFAFYQIIHVDIEAQSRQLKLEIEENGNYLKVVHDDSCNGIFFFDYISINKLLEVKSISKEQITEDMINKIVFSGTDLAKLELPKIVKKAELKSKVAGLKDEINKLNSISLKTKTVKDRLSNLWDEYHKTNILLKAQ